ncbi:MAG: hypothetical protein B7Z08_08100 [Sphingomonadales bacterium 32-68-7]|nr:MAG: hypothetical protein B7Z08_08100 [Sphingomonadales bacterium 32-68-7]
MALAVPATDAVPASVAAPLPAAAQWAAPAWQWSDLAGYALALWLVGALAFLAWRIVSYRRMCRMLLERARPVGEAGRVRLVETPEVAAPVAFGVLDKVVALPPCFMAQPDRAARDLAIEHELAHHRGHDLLANFAAQLLLALHWFNPLAWYGWRAMRRDQEAACDARVLAGRGRDDRARYAALIAGIASGPRLALAAPMACPILGEASIIHRLRSLNMSDVTPRRRRLGRMLLAGGALALPLTASISYAAAPDTPAADAPATRQHRVIVVDKEAGASADDAALVTHLVRRTDGTTVELRTDRQVSEEEARERVEQTLGAAAPVPPAPPLAPVPPNVMVRAPMPPMPPMVTFAFNSQGVPGDPEFEARMEAWGEEMEKWGEEHGERFAAQAEAHARAAARSVPEVLESCDPAEQRRTTTADGRTRIVICQRDIERFSRAGASAGLRGARSAIAANRAISDEVRREILDDLDREIERLERGEG